jgi:hypothetical protein
MRTELLDRDGEFLRLDNVSWLKDCEICNVGLCKRIDGLKAEGKSVREAARIMESESDNLWEADKIRDRYRYYKGGKGGGKSPTALPVKKPMPPKPDIVAMMLTEEDHAEIDRMVSSDPAGHAGYETQFLVSVKRLEAMRKLGGVLKAFADATGKDISDYKGWWPQLKALCDFGKSCLQAKKEMSLVWDTLDVITAMNKVWLLNK